MTTGRALALGAACVVAGILLALSCDGPALVGSLLTAALGAFAVGGAAATAVARAREDVALAPLVATLVFVFAAAATAAPALLVILFHCLAPALA